MRKLLGSAVLGLWFLGSCGGGGSSNQSAPLSLYFTDDMSIYSSVKVKVYEVNLCSDNQCQQKVNLFSSQQGLEVDLAKLNGVLQYINTSNIPQGTYSRLEVVMDKNLEITDNQTHQAQFSPMQEKPHKPNTVQCDAQKCYIRFNGVVQPFSMGKLVVDFVLKEFEVNTSTNPWLVTEVKMKPLTPDEMSKSYKVYVKVQSVNPQTKSFTGTWMAKTYTVNLSSNLQKCEINDQNYNPSDCINHIQVGMCLEVKSLEDPASTMTLTAVKVESEESGKCGS